ncbi:MAG TPA: glycosyltransferase family 39 protein [Chitinophagaceae bacterium]|nr:glycosyltransferase family 39 protein [Chitinophagaceae bacterium]
MNTKINDYSIGWKRFTSFSGFVESSKKAQTFTAILIIMAFAGVNILSVLRGFSFTMDEDKHYRYGKSIVSGNSDRFDDSKMPATALNALPQKVASFLDGNRLKNFLGRLYVARMVTIFFSCLIAFLVFHWARLLYGFVPALFSLVLYVLDPNITAHSQLVTTDLYATGTIAFAFFCLWKFAHERSLRNGLLCLFALGISQLAKYTAIVLFPLFFIVLLLFDISTSARLTHARENLRAFVIRYIKYSILAVIASVLIINLGFLFNRTFTYFGDYHFHSVLFQNIQKDFPSFDYLPVPVPYPYLEGLDWMRNTEQTGSLSGNVYLLGRISPLKGFPGYYIIASALKVPIATQIILLLSLWVYFTQKNRRCNFFRDEGFLLIAVAFFTIYFNFFFNTQIGIRYYLPVFPLLYIFAGNLFIGWKELSFVKKISAWALVAYLFVSVFSYYPYYISYFNEIVWDRKQAYKYLADSNIDWGQGRNELRQYLSKYPGAAFRPNNVRAGRIVVGVNDLVGVTTDPEKYAWLRNNFEPIDMIAYSYMVYKISPEEIDSLCATTTYCDK